MEAVVNWLFRSISPLISIYTAEIRKIGIMFPKCCCLWVTDVTKVLQSLSLNSVGGGWREGVAGAVSLLSARLKLSQA